MKTLIMAVLIGMSFHSFAQERQLTNQTSSEAPIRKYVENQLTSDDMRANPVKGQQAPQKEISPTSEIQESTKEHRAPKHPITQIRDDDKNSNAVGKENFNTTEGLNSHSINKKENSVKKSTTIANELTEDQKSMQLKNAIKNPTPKSVEDIRDLK